MKKMEDATETAGEIGDEAQKVGFIAGMQPGSEDTTRFLFLVSQLRKETFGMTLDRTWYKWDVTRACELLDARQAPVEPFRSAAFAITPEHILERYPDLDIAHASQLTDEDLERPLLFVPLRGRHQLIDGWHRLYRAVTDGIAELPARVLTDEEANAVLVEYAHPVRRKVGAER